MGLTLVDRGFAAIDSASTATTTMVSAAYVAPPGSLHVVAVTGLFAAIGVTYSITDTFAGTGTWTQVTVGGTEFAADTIRTSIFYAQAGGNPGSGTVTVTRTAGTETVGAESQFLTVDGDGTLSVRQSATNLGTGTTLAVTFGSTPLVAGLVIGAIAIAATTTPGVTQPAGWTETRDNRDTQLANHEVASKNGSAVINPTWSAIDNGAGANAYAAAIEIIETISMAPGPPAFGMGGQGPLSWQWQPQRGADSAGPATTPQTLTATQTQTPTISTVTSRLRTLTATETQTPTISRVTSHLLTLSATGTQTPTLTASRAFLRTLTATETQTPTITTTLTRAQTLSATETQTPTMTRVTSHLLTLSATETQTPTATRVTAHLLTLSATESQTITFNRVTAHLLTLSATETQTPNLLAVRATLRTLSVTETQTPTITATFQAGAVVTVHVIPPLQHTLNRLAATLALSLDAQGAANVWAGTTGLELVHALNRKAGTSGLELNGVAKLLASQLSGDSSLDVDGALASIPLPGGAFTLAAPTRRRRLLTAAVRHKKTVAVGSVGIGGTVTALLRGILL